MSLRVITNKSTKLIKLSSRSLSSIKNEQINPPPNSNNNAQSQNPSASCTTKEKSSTDIQYSPQLQPPVLATTVNFPFLPGLQSYFNSPRDFIFNKGVKSAAYFLSKKTEKESWEVNSLKDIYSVGSLGNVESIPSISLGSKTSPPFLINSPSMIEVNVFKTVEAVRLKKGFVYYREYGDPSIAEKHFKDMPTNTRNLFIALRRSILNFNEKRIKFAPDLTSFNYRRVPETVEQLRFLAGILFPDEPLKLQSILERKTIPEVLEEMKNLIVHQTLLFDMQQETTKKVLQEMYESKKHMFYTKQLAIIKTKLGMSTVITKDRRDVSKMVERMRNMNAPKEVTKFFNEELGRMEEMAPHSMEYDGIRNHLEWLSKLPWNKFSEDNFDLEKAGKIMEEDHYGIREVKDRILEFIAVGKRKNNITAGKILCLVGPPGVGKTSMGRSIAKALGKKFVSMSVGGLNDPCEIKGHRRTYIGSMPGKIIQLLKKANTMNPLIMIDEIDKISLVAGHRGDPSATMLEILDPSQNSEYMDNYIDLPVDLSKILFICTANQRDTISAPLADRIEFISLSGYINTEKLVIAKRYLIPKVLKECGLTEKDVEIDDKALNDIIKWYCREPGMRNLERKINKIMRKVAVKVAKEDARKKILINENNLEEYLGKRKFTNERFLSHTPIGVAMGMAWNEMGGSSLYVETEVVGNNTDKNKVNYRATGSLGSVINESISIAFSVARKWLSSKNAIAKNFFDEKFIHVHFPEGATKKDGPSAGITLTCALISLASQTPLKPNLAMTGELTLTGYVLPVGGIREKVVSAKRSMVDKVILPKDNLADWTELDPEVKEGITPFFVEKFADVYRAAFQSNSQ